MFGYWQDLSYFSSGGGDIPSNTAVDDMDGPANNFSMPPGTPEYHKVRLAMEQIHVSGPSLNTAFTYFIYYDHLRFCAIIRGFSEIVYSRHIWHIILGYY